MGWMTTGTWLAAILTFVQWRSRWALCGGVSLRGVLREGSRSLGSMQGLMLLAGVFSIVTLPFSILYDLIPPSLIPLQVPLALIGLFGATGPVSFLVLGPSRGETSETCGRLLFAFPLLRAGAAVDPIKLGALLDHQLGPVGNLWMGSGGGSWQEKLAGLVRDTPLVVFDGRVISNSTRWEFFHLLFSGQLAKVVVVGPVGDTAIAAFLQRTKIVPVVELHVLSNVLKATATRRKLLNWYSRRRYSIVEALEELEGQPSIAVHGGHPITWSGLSRFDANLPEILRLYRQKETSPV